MLNAVLGALSRDMAIDLGTAHTRIHVVGRDGHALPASCSVPTAVAIYTDAHDRRQVVAVGEAARAMIGRTPPDLRVVRPVQDGVIADFEVVEVLLRELMVRVQGRHLWVGPRVAMSVPHGTNDVERRALREAAEAAGAREVVLVDHPLAAAAGAGLPVQDACGHMVVDVGAGTTRVAVVSLGGVVYSHTLKVGGEHIDQAVSHHLRERWGLLVGPLTAEAVKCRLAAAVTDLPDAEMRVRGRDAATGMPREVRLHRRDLVGVLSDPFRLMVGAVLSALDHVPPDLAADIAEVGAVMTGGGALLAGMDRALSTATGMPVAIPEHPMVTVARGAAYLLSSTGLRAAG